MRLRSTFVTRLIALLTMLSTCGCGTIASLAESPAIYGGVRMDIEGIAGDSCCPSPGSLLVFDLPFSLVFDTVVLPYTIPYELFSRKDSADQAKDRENGSVAAAKRNLERISGELTPVVEAFCGTKFRSVPRYRFPSPDEWKAFIRTKNPFSRDPSLLEAITLAVYDEESNVILVGLITQEWLAADMSPDSERSIRVVLAHELTHALDEEHYGLVAKMRRSAWPGERFVRHSLIEGHAVMVEEHLVEKEGGRKDYFKKRYDAKSPAHRKYVLGRNYLKRVLKEEGPEGLKEALTGDPPELGVLSEKGAIDPDENE